MPSTELLVNVSFREIALQSARLCDFDGSGGFLETDSPLPVGTSLVIASDQVPVTARVVRVVEACRTAAPEARARAGAQLVFESSAESLLAQVENAALSSSESPGDADQVDLEPGPSETSPGYESPMPREEIQQEVVISAAALAQQGEEPAAAQERDEPVAAEAEPATEPAAAAAETDDAAEAGNDGAEGGELAEDDKKKKKSRRGRRKKH